MPRYTCFPNGQRMRDWHSIDLEHEGDRVRVFFNSRIHVEKRIGPVAWYTTEFTDSEILRGVLPRFLSTYGDDAVTCAHCGR